MYNDLDPGGKRSREDEVLEECYRSWEVQLLVRREGTIPERAENLRNWWLRRAKDPCVHGTEGCFVNTPQWPQEAELFPHFIDIGCSLSELHSLEARILFCVAGREWFSPAHIRGPWEIQTERPLYSRPQKIGLSWLPVQRPPLWIWCLLQPHNYPKKEEKTESLKTQEGK